MLPSSARPAMATTNSFGKSSQQPCYHGTKDSDEHIKQAAPHCGGIALGGIGMRFGAHADGGSDGRQVQTKGAERCQKQY